ncbi:MAG TPA: RsmB/NOP family class I SAM-dependent RNA methyltransferase, partial [Myxococcaceae bacterium]|nr:RsmB/NOP family class I SAM-dependent RNA methyltransferase [Myxococcaceae bacterium]
MVDHVLRQNRGWTAEVRTAAVEALFGVSLWRRRLAYQAGLPDPRPEWARDLLYALLHGLGLVEAESAAGAVGLE